ncbi:3-hydroxyacyl-CoA dehydrogenase NAD-binding domain-containing protein [Bartonella sp. DGB2]|uniref:3-hydroxyacyl-CoA dehydrogenase/enoyl-CoA hydratase family protein n=1 Tax=Bartonella sp. DGB2 TaxID=3388426 RepID=UPI00398FDB35
MSAFQKAAVIGAGVMGSAIAAHLANAGVRVILLDIETKFAEAGVARQVKNNGFMDPSFAKRVRTGSSKTDLSLIANADWIIEAVAEKLEIKQVLYKQIEEIRKSNSIVSSNTSTIPLSALTKGLPESFTQDFLITHFFNPPRIMRLLELVSGPTTKPAIVTAIRKFADHALGKSVVLCKDTPGFIGNRIGNYWMVVAQNEAINLGLDIEEADAVISKPFGIPRTGIFSLLDLVGIDLAPMALHSLQKATPEGDPIKDYDAEPPLLKRMIAENRLGRKSGAGFVRLSPDRKSRDVTDLKTGDYRPQRPVSSQSLEESGGSPRALMEHTGLGGRYASVVMEKTLSYAAALVPQIADTPDAIDEAMRTGYGWKWGPFELIDKLGAVWLKEHLKSHKLPIPPYLQLATEKDGFYHIINGTRSQLLPNGTITPIAKNPGVLLLNDLKLAHKPVTSWESAALWDLGDGVACFELQTKMNTFNPQIMQALEQAIERCKKDFRALVIGSDRPVFSAGADLRLFLESVAKGGVDAIRASIDQGHATFKTLKYAPFPVVGAACGVALGGGCEALLHCDAIQAHADLIMGLVEVGVGIVPGWGGCKEMLWRFANNPRAPHGPLAPAMAAFDLIGLAKVSTSAFHAKKLGYLQPSDGITMNRSRLIADAKAKALSLAQDYTAPKPPTFALAGPSGAALIRNVIKGEFLAGRASAHDGVVGGALADILTGGKTDPLTPLNETDITTLEREACVTLFTLPLTQERIKHMLVTGKPLRN